MKVHVAVLFAVLALVASIQANASAATPSMDSASAAQVLTTTSSTASTASASDQQGLDHGAPAAHATRHHVRSAVVQRRGGRTHTGGLTLLPEGLRSPGRPTLVAASVGCNDRLLDRAVTTHPLRL